MAREHRGPSFTQRVAAANLTPQQRENAAATLLLAELVDELCGLIAQQTDRLDEQNDRLAEQNELLDDIRNGRRGERTARPPAAPGTGDEGKGGGGHVRITEPATPPPDPDEGPDSGRAVAEPATEPAPAGRPAAKKTARAATQAKKTTTAAPRRPRSTGKG